MKKILFLLIIFLVFSEKSFSSNNKPTNLLVGCSTQITHDHIKNINNFVIKKIEIDTHNYRKWTINSIKIITGNSRFIADEYKKRFNATVAVTYENNLKFVFEGRVRHSGDARDHIALHGNYILQSLDVHLINGNIRGITKFKLFRPNVRGVLEDVIIQTELLRNLNYLAPRSIIINSRINQAESVMLFQEKAAKELLEHNSRREGPILEGDQKFFFKLVANIPNNQLSNWSVGTPFLRSKSIKAMLTKQTNSNIINKNENYKRMSYNALTNLNLIYLYYANRFQDEKNNFNFFDYDLDNQLLGFFNQKNVLKLDVYNLLMQSTNSHHALSSSNRKFYWNSIENYFEPINYDSNPYIEGVAPTTTTTSFRLPVSQQLDEAFIVLESKLRNLDLKEIHLNLINSGAGLTREDLDKKINKILLNLLTLKKNYSKLEKEIIEHNKFRETNDIFSIFYTTLNEIDPDVYLVKHGENKKAFQKCNAYLKDCSNLNLSSENVAKLLEGELVLKGDEYQYVGKNTESISFVEANPITELKFKDTRIFYSSGIEIKFNPEEEIININQNTPGARVFILGGMLKNTTINFNGYKKEFKNLQNYPIDDRGLTGCLSLINISLKNISINSNKSSCEDSVNLINTTGSINKIDIQNSYMDGLDIDFSKLEIKRANIKDSKNDCLDLSFGEYKLGEINLSNCGDKGLSVGEKSLVQLNNIKIKNSNIGIASKDSSITKLNNAFLENLTTCVTAYNKKQEFYGGFLKIKNVDCKNYNEKTKIDNYSKIVLENEL